MKRMSRAPGGARSGAGRRRRCAKSIEHGPPAAPAAACVVRRRRIRYATSNSRRSDWRDRGRRGRRRAGPSIGSGRGNTVATIAGAGVGLTRQSGQKNAKKIVLRHQCETRQRPTPIGDSGLAPACVKAIAENNRWKRVALIAASAPSVPDRRCARRFRSASTGARRYVRARPFDKLHCPADNSTSIRRRSPIRTMQRTLLASALAAAWAWATGSISAVQSVLFR